MDEGAAAESLPDLKDVEVKIGRKTPEGLLRWMREDASSLRGDAKLAAAHDTGKETGKRSLDEKIRKLRMEMAHLRSVDVKILQQLLAVHEGIEAVKWLLEERSTLTSRCSSLTSSQYSLGEGPDTSWRGSWSSLQDPNDKLDNISIGSYLDTLADDMDEYCPSSSESVLCSTTPLASEATAASRTPTARSGSGIRAGTNENAGGAKHGTDVKEKAATGSSSAVAAAGVGGTGNGKAAALIKSSPQKILKQDAPVWTKAAEKDKESPSSTGKTQTQAIRPTGSPARSHPPEKLETSQSPKLKPYKNGKIDLDTTCKMNGKMHLEYDAHWRWVQSQEDVTFL